MCISVCMGVAASRNGRVAPPARVARSFARGEENFRAFYRYPSTKKRPSEELTNGSRSGTLNKRELLPPSAPFGASTNYAMGHSVISVLSILTHISSAIGSRKASVQILIPSNFTKRCYQTKIYYPPKKPGRSSLDVEDWRCVSVLPMLAPVVVGGV